MNTGRGYVSCYHNKKNIDSELIASPVWQPKNEKNKQTSKFKYEMDLLACGEISQHLVDELSKTPQDVF